MDKEWYIIIGDQQEGPYSLLDLWRDERLTPDTLVWKRGFQEWTPARFVPELKEIFKDKPQPQALHEKPKKKRNSLGSDLGQQEQVTLAIRQDPPQLVLWLLILLLILFFYFLYRY